MTDPRSLVLTQEVYQAYWKRTLSDCEDADLVRRASRHIIGYSVSDPHIRLLLTNLVECLTEQQLSILNDRMIFVSRRKPGEPTQFTNATLTVSSHTIAIREYGVADYSELYEMLASLPRRFPAKLMRQMKESVYRLAYDRTPQGRLRVLPIGEAEDLEDLQFVVGVGTSERLAEIGYGHFGREDLIRDMLFGATQHNPDVLMSRTVPELFSQVKYMPIYYPLRLAGRIDESGAVSDIDGLPGRARDLLADDTLIQPTSILENSPRRAQHFRELVAEGEKLAINHGVWCHFDESDDVALRDFLLMLLARARKTTTEIAKLACKYDRLVFGLDFEADRTALLELLNVDAV